MSNALQQLHHSFNFYFFTGPNSHISNGSLGSLNIFAINPRMPWTITPSEACLSPPWNQLFSHENRPGPNRKVVFQPSIFRCYISFRESIPSVSQLNHFDVSSCWGSTCTQSLPCSCFWSVFSGQFGLGSFWQDQQEGLDLLIKQLSLEWIISEKNRTLPYNKWTLPDKNLQFWTSSA